MNARAALYAMISLSALTAAVSIGVDRIWFGVAAVAASSVPIISVIGGQRLWRPWWLDGVDADLPDVRPFGWQAAIFEALMIFGLLAGASTALLAFRLMGVAIQLSTIGKYSRETSPEQSNENCPEPSPRRNPRHPRQ